MPSPNEYGGLLDRLAQSMKYDAEMMQLREERKQARIESQTVAQEAKAARSRARAARSEAKVVKEQSRAARSRARTAKSEVRQARSATKEIRQETAQEKALESKAEAGIDRDEMERRRSAAALESRIDSSVEISGVGRAAGGGGVFWALGATAALAAVTLVARRARGSRDYDNYGVMLAKDVSVSAYTQVEADGQADAASKALGMSNELDYELEYDEDIVPYVDSVDRIGDHYS
jgi:hypothetical protein